MLAGANQLNAATTKLGADTGLSGAALQQQGQAIDSLYKNSLQSMDSIESSLATVISGFHLTGQAADDLTAQFLTYEDATGQGSEAVTALKEVTDAYNLSASDEGNIWICSWRLISSTPRASAPTSPLSPLWRRPSMRWAWVSPMASTF